MPHKLPRHLHRQITRHGATVFYVRKGHGPRVRIQAEFGTDDFWKEYRAALEGASAPEPQSKIKTLKWALDLYRQTSAWAQLSNATRRQRENIYRDVIKKAGAQPLAAITKARIIAAREDRKDHPHAANNFLKAMRGFFGWAAGDGALVSANPTLGVKLLEGKNDDGFHTWTQHELAAFEATYPLGTRERLAYDIFGYTGLRRGDAAVLGRQHRQGDIYRIVAEKTGEEVVFPALPELDASIAAADAAGITGDLTYIVTESGKPFAKESLGNWFGEACRKAKCPGSAHGLRKALAVRWAEDGATEKQLMALFGWTSGKMASHYTKKADQARLAREAAEQWKNRKIPHPISGEGKSSESVVKSTQESDSGAQERVPTSRSSSKT